MSVGDSTYLAPFGDGASVLERVLLAIINAHTDAETEGRQWERLQAAMTALVGTEVRDGQDTEGALLFMVRARQKDICDAEMRVLSSRAASPTAAVRTIPELANFAARQVMGCTDASQVQATARVLCEMFRRRGKACAAEPDHVREAMEAEAVRRVLGELAEWDVPSIRPK